MKPLLIAMFVASTVAAGENSVMHCFAWTAKPEATEADWKTFAKASDDLPQKIDGIIRVWYGSLAARLSQVSIEGIDKESFKKLQDGERVTTPAKRLWREYGMCMEMKSADALKAYDADSYHQVWIDAYSKVRVEGTTTFDILGR